MTRLFENVACFTDIHYGLKHNAKLHNLDCIDFTEWFIEQAQLRDCETCIFLGDFHHHRSSINVSTMHHAFKGLELLNEAFKNVYIITGNHDLFYREKRDVSSLIISKNFNNIHLIDEPIVIKDVALVPWLVEEEWKTVKSIKSKYMFGHFEIPGFKMNAHVEMPDQGHINRRHFEHQDYVFSGHFHKRQAKDNVHYIGNPFGHNYADAWDDERGAMFLTWGEKPEYVNWDNSPKYITCLLSDLLNNVEEYLKPKTHARVTLDVDISYEEANFLRETFLDTYNIRELKLIHSQDSEHDQEVEGEITFQTVDQIVVEQLNNIESDTFDTARLIEIYNGL